MNKTTDDPETLEVECTTFKNGTVKGMRIFRIDGNEEKDYMTPSARTRNEWRMLCDGMKRNGTDALGIEISECFEEGVKFRFTQ
jgi:hypothetical protein